MQPICISLQLICISQIKRSLRPQLQLFSSSLALSFKSNVQHVEHISLTLKLQNPLVIVICNVSLLTMRQKSVHCQFSKISLSRAIFRSEEPELSKIAGKIVVWKHLANRRAMPRKLSRDRWSSLATRWKSHSLGLIEIVAFSTRECLFCHVSLFFFSFVPRTVFSWTPPWIIHRTIYSANDAFMLVWWYLKPWRSKFINSN